jgi:hypothetical protein
MHGMITILIEIPRKGRRGRSRTGFFPDKNACFEIIVIIGLKLGLLEKKGSCRNGFAHVQLLLNFEQGKKGIGILCIVRPIPLS